MDRRITSFLLLAQLVSTAGMFGVIWQVQWITYPGFFAIDPVSFPDYHADYCRRITWIVGPLMLVELGSTAFSLLALWRTRLRAWSLLALSLVLSAWAMTAFLQVPLHEKLSSGLDTRAAENLVRSNWFRVVAWTLHLGVIVRILNQWILTGTGSCEPWEKGTNDPVQES